MENYTHITDDERRKIERAREKGESIRSIAKKLGRSPNSVSYELRKNASRNEYTRSKAQAKANAIQQLSNRLGEALQESLLKRL